MKRYLILMIITLLVSCSNSIDNNESRTFLEIYDGTIWYNNDQYDPEYYRIVNDQNIIVEFWDYGFLGACSSYRNTGNEINYEIIENSESKLVIQFVYGDGIVIDSYSVIQGNLVWIESSPATGFTRTHTLSPSEADVDSWVICDD